MLKRAALALIALIFAACTVPAQVAPQVNLIETAAPAQSLPTPAAVIPTQPAVFTPLSPPFGEGVLMTTWDQKQERHLLHAVDPRTGEDLSGYPPIDLGKNYARHAFSPNGKTLAVVSYGSTAQCSGEPATCTAPDGQLRLLDLQTWREVNALKAEDWATALSFSPNGTQLAVAYDGKYNGTGNHVTLIDLATQTVIAQASLGFIPQHLQYTPDSTSLMVYGVKSGAWGQTPFPPRAALVNAADLTIEWETTLTHIRDGNFPIEGSTDPHNRIWLKPAIVFAPDGSALFIVHADEDKLTIVDFDEHATRTVDIQPPQSLLERLIALTADAAQAKTWNWTTKEAVISPDGKRLYVTGEVSAASENAKGQSEVTQTSLGLQVIEAFTGAELARHETEATQIAISPDGARLYLQGWRQTGPYEMPWTEIWDTATFSRLAQLDELWARPSRTLNGQTVLVSSHVQPNGQISLALIDLETLHVVHSWATWGSAGWLTY
jgi:DNA-binding beta-propeller fold protein YncE